jgi:hypothetical protein
VQLSQCRLGYGLGFEGDLGGNFCGADSDAGFLGLHLAVAGGFGVARGYAGCGLSSATGAGSNRLGRSRGLIRAGLAIFMFRNAAVDFLSPCGGLATCTHSYIPFNNGFFNSGRSPYSKPLLLDCRFAADGCSLERFEFAENGRVRGKRLKERRLDRVGPGPVRAEFSCCQSRARSVLKQEAAFAMLSLG